MLFFDYAKLPSVEKIKDCLQRVALLGTNFGGRISDVDKKLSDEIFDLTYSMLCYHKQSKKTFTIKGNSKLRNMRIGEDADGIAPEDSLYITSLINENLLDAFAELSAYTFLPKQEKNEVTRLFAANYQSKYSGKKHFVFFAKNGDNVYVFTNQLTDIKLTDYISTYFSTSNEPDSEILQICDIAKNSSVFLEAHLQILEIANKFNDAVDNKHSFVHGAITFLDFLGWKGLWQSQSAHDSLKEVSDLIEDFREKLAELSKEYYSSAGDIPLSALISISDTIAVFSPLTVGAKVQDLLKIHAKFAKYVLEKCAELKYSIRGAINYGEYSIINNIMIGPGIDECASWHEMGNWIGVHLTPTAQIYWEEYSADDKDICSYSVPLKAGYQAQYCIKWDISKEMFKTLALKSRALLPEISGKYTNTYNFLKKFSWKEDKSNG